MTRLSNIEAVKAIGRGVGSLTMNFLEATDRAAHRYPYAFIVPVVIGAFLICYIGIAKARAERDAAYINNSELRQQVDTLEVQLRVAKKHDE